MRIPALILIIIIATTCSPSKTFTDKEVALAAPDTYTVRFETSKGNFDIQVTREWSPKAADRFYRLIKHRYYDRSLFYRVVPNFVVQWGIDDSTINKNLEKYKVPDEPVLSSNTQGRVSYARGGKDTRGTDLFINLKDNTRLDTINSNGVKGFPPFGTVTNGFDVVKLLYSGYGNKPMEKYDSMFINRKLFLANFPQLDSIKKAYLVKPK